MRSAATAFPRSPEGAAAPESCLLSVTLPPTPPQLSIRAGPDQAFFSSPAPSADGQAEWAGRRLAGPPSCQLRGWPSRRAGARWLPRRSLARAPLRLLWGSRGRSSGRRHRLARTSSPGPLQAQSLPPAHPRVVSGPALGPESNRGGAGWCLNHVKEDFAEGKRVKPSFRQHVSGRARALGCGCRHRAVEPRRRRGRPLLGAGSFLL